MRKYLSIYKSEVMSTISYVFNILIHTIGYIVMIFIFFNLWNYIYDDPGKIINGYSKEQMIWYVIITEIIWSAVGGRLLCKKISNDVKGGNIAYIMNKPYSYIGYAVSSHLGETTIKSIITAIVGIGMGLIFFKGLPNISFLGILIVLISSFLAVIISTLFITFIGLFSFIIEDSNPFYWLYSKIILVLGTIFPIEFFPGVLGTIIKYSPIYVTCYGPAKLFVDFDTQNAMHIIAAQILYVGIAWAMCYLLYRKGVKKLNVNGG